MSRYIANVFPLLKFLVDVGEMAVQVSIQIALLMLDGGLRSSFCCIEGILCRRGGK